MDETELTQDGLNDLPGDERDVGWDLDEETSGPLNAPGTRPRQPGSRTG